MIYPTCTFSEGICVWLSDLKSVINSTQICFSAFAGVLGFFGGSILAVPRIFDDEEVRIMFFGNSEERKDEDFLRAEALLARVQIIIIICSLLIVMPVCLISVAKFKGLPLWYVMSYSGPVMMNLTIGLILAFVLWSANRASYMGGSLEYRITKFLVGVDDYDITKGRIRKKLNASGTIMSVIATVLTICAVYLGAIKPA